MSNDLHVTETPDVIFNVDDISYIPVPGPQGPPGPQGEKGEKGDKGDKGDTGATGPTGPQGEQGIQGIQGIQGEQGPKGDTGPKGDKGDKGDTGAQGPTGATGPKGDKGEKGDTGEQGPQGEQGEQGPKGETGPKGDTGATGATGPTGPQGPAGADGEDGFTPIISTAPIQDGYEITIINEDKTTTIDIYNGQDGATGPQGPQGPAGADGADAQLTILSYGHSTWNDFITAYANNLVIYCRASSGSDPGSGSQTRLAFMAYVNNASNPTEVEFQYYRSVNSHTDAQQGDQVFVYKLTSAGTWTVTTRNTFSKVDVGSGLSKTYSNGVITINLDLQTWTGGSY